MYTGCIRAILDGGTSWKFAVKLLSRVIGFLKFPMLPEDGLSKTEICCSLQHIYMIFSFLIILKL